MALSVLYMLLRYLASEMVFCFMDKASFSCAFGRKGNKRRNASLVQFEDYGEYECYRYNFALLVFVGVLYGKLIALDLL